MSYDNEGQSDEKATRLTKEDKLAQLHAELVAEFDDIQSAVRDERLQCLQDRRFYSISGAQWEGPLEQQFENKPKFEVNKVHLAVIRIINEYRNNRITVNFVPKDGAENNQLTDACQGLYRADEQDSVAEEAYDNAFEEAVGGGYGAYRLTTEYTDESDEEDETQRIRIKPIFDADSSVFWDLDAKRQDKSDAKKCFVLSSMTIGAYEEEWDESPASWAKGVFQTQFDWFTPDVVFVAEVYCVEMTKDVVNIFQGVDETEKRYLQSELDDDEDNTVIETLKATGFRLVRTKKIKVKKVRKYIMDGGRILEDCGYIAGPNIPIVPVYGKRWFVDNVERCMGHVRLAKDAQRLKNMQLSKLGEISALSTVEKPIMTPEEIAGHTIMWSEDNIKNYPYLLKNRALDLNGNPVAVPMEYTRVPQIPPAMAALLQITEQDMQDMLGNQQAGEELPTNVSGIAVELVQNKLDMQTFIYMSNMSKAVKRGGEIWLGMAKEVLVEKDRMLKTVDQSGTVSSIKIDKPALDKKTGAAILENHFADANFDVVADVGPSSDSKRSSTVRALTGMMQISTDPETVQVLGAMAMMNMEGEGIEDVRGYYRNKLIHLGVIKPTPEEAQDLAKEQEAAAQKPDPQAEFLMASAAKAAADSSKAKADTILTMAKVDQTKAQTAETLAGVDISNEQHLISTVDALHNALQPQPVE
jgi:Phage P22-like portal protein